MTFLLALLLAQQTVTKPGTAAPYAQGVQGVPGGVPVPTTITNSISVAGAADTVGADATFNANTICAVVSTAGQPGAGFFLAAGTLAATLTPSISEDATPSGVSCSGGNYTASKFVTDVNGNTSTTLVLTNPNAFVHYGVATLAGTRCVKVCTTAFTSGSAVGHLTGTVALSPSPAPSADVTDRAGRLLGKVYGSDGNQVATANTGRLQVDIVTGGGSNSSVGSTGAAVPASATYGGMNVAGNLTGLPGTANGLKVDGSAVTQPVSGSVTANIGTSGSLALDATLTGGTQKAIVRGGAKGATAAADVTSTANGADHQGLDVAVQGSVAVTGPVTDAQLRASAVPVSGPLTDAQLRASAVPTTDAHTTAAAPLSSRLSDGAAFYDATKTGQLPAALDGSGFLKTHEQGTAAISAASLPLPAGAATESTLSTLSGKFTDDTAGSTFADEAATNRLAARAALLLYDSGATVNQRLRPWQGDSTSGAWVNVKNATLAVTQSGSWTADVTDRAARLLGVVYGSQAQQIKQTATNFNLQAELAVGGTLIDPRAIRALTSSDTVTVVQPTGTNMHVVCDSGCTPGGSFADGSAFTENTTAINVSGGVYNEAFADLDPGEAGAPRVTAKRAFHVNLRDPFGLDLTKGSGQTPTSKDPSVVVQFSPNSPVTFNALVPPKVQIAGTTKVQVVDPQGRTASVTNSTKPPTTNDQAQVVAQSPVPAPVCTDFVSISQAASTRLIVGGGGQRIYICEFSLVSATAQTVALIEGTGTTCGTAGVALYGHTTVANGMAFAANGGLAQAAASPFKMTRVSGDDLCLLQSGAGNLSGSISYVQR